MFVTSCRSTFIPSIAAALTMWMFWAALLQKFNPDSE